MDECLLFVSDVHKGSVKGWHHFFYFAEKNISDSETVPFAGLLVQLYEAMVFHQSQFYLIFADINNQIFN